MSFSSEWENLYVDKTNLSIWPWSDVVRLVYRHCKSLITAGGGHVLEFGCGAGANIPLFHALGMHYYAVEGSPTIVDQLHQRYPDIVNNIRVGDFTVDQPFDLTFDLVFDRAALTHNSTTPIKIALQYAYESLKPGGIFIGSDWLSRNFTNCSGGEAVDDEYTRTNYSEGPFAGVGKVHFSDEAHLRDLFAKFEIIFMEEKIIRSYEPLDSQQLAFWNIVASKPIN